MLSPINNFYILSVRQEQVWTELSWQMMLVAKIEIVLASIAEAVECPSKQLPLHFPRKQFCISSLLFRAVQKSPLKLSVGTLPLLTRIVEILLIVKQNLSKQEVITKRSLYYTLSHYYRDYALIDDDIEIISLALKVKREELNIVSSSRCLIYGEYHMCIDGKEVSSQTAMITNVPNFKELTKVHTPCRKLLIVEKQSMFYHIYQQILKGCIETSFLMLTAKGYPDSTSRTLLAALYQSSPIEIYYLGDHDIYGADIFLRYAVGHEQNQYPTIVDRLIWIQMDGFSVQLRDKSIETQQLSKEDRKKGNQILNREYFRCIERVPDSISMEIFSRKMKVWRGKIQDMLRKNQKIELEGYLPQLPQGWLDKLFGNTTSNSFKLQND